MQALLNPIAAAATAWHESKLFIEHFAAICHETLHLIAGTSIWLALVTLRRRSIKDWMPLLLTLAAAVLNEAVDLWVEIWPNTAMQLGEGARDVVTTIAVPTLFLLFARWSPAAFDPAAIRTGKPAEGPRL